MVSQYHFCRFPLSRQFLQTLLLLMLTVLTGCAPKALRQVPFQNLPVFKDDHTFSSLKKAVARSVSYLEKLPPDKSFTFSNKTYSASFLKESLHEFFTVVEHSSSPEEFHREITKNFDIFQARGTDSFRHSGEMLVTGYFEPILDGSLTRNASYHYPLYAVPPDLVSIQDNKPNKKKIGRFVDGQLVPYWTRGEIENHNLLTGLELVYLADPVDAFILHVQGSGKIRLPDGSLRGIHFAALNGRPYRSIGRLLVDEGRMKLEEVDLTRIKQYLADHPAELNRILHHNESFVFFKWEDNSDPVGSLGEMLTAGRSVAADQDYFPAGGLGFLQSYKPVLGRNGKIAKWVPMSRFVLVQDSGSAIKGTGRIDMFWGNSHYAKIAAGSMKHPGKLFFLVEKQ